MYQSETTTIRTVSFGHDGLPRSPSAASGRSNLISRYLPIPIVVGGVVATVAWTGLVAWWIFSFVRWMIV